MKTVYIDVVFACNFAIDYLLLYLSSVFLNIKVKTVRLIYGGIMGGLSAVIIGVLVHSSLVRFSITMLFLFLMSVVSFGKAGVKKHIKIAVTMYVFSFLLCGFVSTVLSGFPSKQPYDYMWLLLVVSAGCFAVLSRKITPVFAAIVAKNKVNVKINVNGNSSCLQLLVDSGNVLIDRYTGTPVILLSYNCIKSVLNVDEIDEAVVEKYHLRPMYITGAVGKGTIYVVTPDIVVCDNSKLNCSIGFVINKNIEFGDCDGAMPHSLVN